MGVEFAHSAASQCCRDRFRRQAISVRFQDLAGDFFFDAFLVFDSIFFALNEELPTSRRLVGRKFCSHYLRYLPTVGTYANMLLFSNAVSSSARAESPIPPRNKWEVRLLARGDQSSRCCPRDWKPWHVLLLMAAVACWRARHPWQCRSTAGRPSPVASAPPR